MHISRSIEIAKPAEEVYKYLNDFHHWATWSPWIIQEPDCKIHVDEDGKFQSWDGKRIGSGEIRITDESENEYINYDLRFLKPWKSKSKTRFELKSIGDITEVTWIMNGSLPFFMFWMKKMMEAFVGMDYQRGLTMLKDLIEDGQVHSKINMNGESQFSGKKYVAIRTNCTMTELGPNMKEDFEKLGDFFTENKSSGCGEAFSIYHKWDVVSGRASYTSGMFVDQVPDQLPSGFIKGEIPATKIFTIGHTGPYTHLGNAWTTLYTMARNKEIRQNKKIDPFETYKNSPNEVPENELVTEVHIPVK